MKEKIFSLLMIGITSFVIIMLLKNIVPFLEERYEHLIAEKLAIQMSGKERAEYYRKYVQTKAGFWEVIPDPDVARIIKEEWAKEKLCR